MLSELSDTPTEQSFIDGYRATLPELFGFVARCVGGDRLLAEDLTSDTYLAAITAWRDGNADAITQPWLRGVARHKMIDRLRRLEREQRKLAIIDASNVDDHNDTSLAFADRDALVRATQQLTPMQRAVVALRYVEDLTIVDVAAALELSVSAVDSHLRRAHTALRTILTQGAPS